VKLERWFLLFLLLALVLGWMKWSERPIEHPPGVLVTSAPVQDRIDSPAIAHRDFTLQPRARFTLSARVLSREDYRFDAGADLAPVDLALGWGPMSDQAVLDRISIEQSARWYRLRWDSAPPIPEEEVMRHSGNMHLIPANDPVRRQLKEVRVGQVLHLRGLLVDASRRDGYRWTTSLSREDVGDGSCELFYLEEVRFLQ
jgi:hypothetical protein